MTTLNSRWNTAVQVAREEWPEHHCYLLIDAAQLSGNAMPWKSLVGGKSVHNLLWDQPEATHPQVCPLLVDYSAPWVDSLLNQYLASRPFAFTVLVTDLSGDALAQALNRRIRIYIDGAGNGLLRFYDSVVLHSVLRLFNREKAIALLAPADVWLYVGRDDEIVELHQNSREAVLVGWSVTEQEQAALRHYGLVDKVAADLTQSGHLPVNADPIMTYQRIARIRSILGEDWLDEAVLYRVCALVLPSGVELDDPVLAIFLARYSERPDQSDDALLDWLDEAELAKQELN